MNAALFGDMIEYPWMLAVAVVMAVAVALIVRWSEGRRRARLAKLGTPEIVSRLVPPAAFRRAWPRMMILGLAALSAGIAMAGPRWGTEQTVVRSSGIDLVLALDASLSMMAADERPSRLERMKQEVRRLRSLSGGDRIGLIAFAGRSYILTPLTVDDGALALFLDNLDPSVVGQAGSSLARAIRQGTALLLASQAASDRALVIMSDGEAFEPVADIEDAARRAREAGISIVTVGFGTPQGSTIPIREGSRTTTKRDESGEVVITRYNPDLLRAAAEAAQGTFIPAEAEDKAGRIRRALSELRTTQRATQAGRDRSPRFQWFLVPAFLLVLLDTLLAERRGRRRRLPAAAKASGEPDRASTAPAASVPHLAPKSAPAKKPKGRTTAAALLLALLIPSVAGAGIADAEKAFRNGQFAQAAALYREAVAAGDRTAETMYNLGTALLAADSLPAAIEALERAATSRVPEVAFRSLFNLGLAQLKLGLKLETDQAQAEQAGAAFESAIDAYRKTLRLRSRDMDAKWNYEIALKHRQKTGGGGGGGGAGEQEEPQPDESSESERKQPRPSGSLGPRQAEELLNSAARDEREVQGKRQKQSRPTPPGGKDW